jgi:hypothetical protein
VKRALCAVDLSNVSVQVLHHAQAIVQGYGGCLAMHVAPMFDSLARPHCPVDRSTNTSGRRIGP